MLQLMQFWGFLAAFASRINAMPLEIPNMHDDSIGVWRKHTTLQKKIIKVCLCWKKIILISSYSKLINAAQNINQNASKILMCSFHN